MPEANETSQPHPTEKKRRITSNIISVIIVVLGIAFFTTNARFKVEGCAMEPTISTQHYLLTYRFAYMFQAPQRGDIVVYPYPERPNLPFVHRIVGLPQETIAIRDDQVFIDDVALEEPYLEEAQTACTSDQACRDAPLLIPEGHVFVLGDNRMRSADSREYGVIPIENIVSRVWLRYYPFDEFGLL